MIQDSSALPLIEALEHTAMALEELQHEKAPHPVRLVEETIARALSRAPGMLRAVTLLLRKGHVLESEPIIRSLIELAINIAWIGSDVQRAEQFRDEGLRQAQVWMRAMQQRGVTFPEDIQTAFDQLVADSTSKAAAFRDLGVEGRARVARVSTARLEIKTLSKLYDISYRRLSAAVHTDHRALALFSEAPALQTLDAQDAVSATLVFVAASAEALGMSNKVDDCLRELMQALQDSTAPSERRPG